MAPEDLLARAEPLVKPLPQGMAQLRTQVLLHKKVAPDHYRMRLAAPLIARRALPGQFIHVRCGEGDSPLLRRPFSLVDLDAGKGTIDFIYKVVGLGTRVLAEVPVGSRIDALGPLGRPFEIPPGTKKAFLIGGGVGIPPLVLLAKQLLKRKCQVSAFLGARTREWVICIPDFRRLGVPTHPATDDGSLGYRGSVVDALQRFLRAADRKRRDTTILYICGPTPMMHAAAALARRRGLAAQVSLEERMGCAMGCCMGCVVEVATEPPASHKRFQRVCTEGPVFPAESIAWR